MSSESLILIYAGNVDTNVAHPSAVADGGGQFLVAFERDGIAASGVPNNIGGQLVNMDGSLAGSNFIISATTADELKPDVVSILVGVNNTWPRYFSNDITNEEAFFNDYHAILQSTVDALNPLLILCEPFILNVSKDIKAWREDLDPKIEVVRKLAKKFSAILVPFDKMFAEASKEKDPAYWAEDGVHPTLAGHELMAKEWLRCVVGIDK